MAIDVQVIPATPAVGAEIVGIDLSAPLSTNAADQIHQALMDHLVVWFRDQPVDPTSVLHLANAMGPLAERHELYKTLPDHPDVVVLDWHGEMKQDAAEWHTDMRYRETYPFATVVQAVVLPQSGGDTLWASMYRAYETLPQHMRKDLEVLEAVHDMGSFRRDYIQQGGAERLNQGMTEMGQAVHPVVGHHPVTGRPYLNVSEAFTTYINGMSFPDSTRLLGFLFAHINRPDHHVRLRWTAGTVAIWDNEASQHYAVNDYLPSRRTLYRTVVASNARQIS